MELEQPPTRPVRLTGSEAVDRKPLYLSEVQIEKRTGPHRKAWIRPFDRPLEFGVHGAIAEFYGATTAEPLPTTLDHVVAAAGG